MKKIIPYELTKFHSEILSIPFFHKNELRKKFRDVLGLLNIDYISIEVTNPEDEFLFFSSFPAVNINLIENHLWPYDGAFSPTFYKQSTFFDWDEVYQPVFFKQLKEMKEVDFDFTYGFILVRKINRFYLRYSFATKNKDPEIKKFYEIHRNDVLKMGDYCYKFIRPIYFQYCDTFVPPVLTSFIPFEFGAPKETDYKANYLKLIVNNV